MRGTGIIHSRENIFRFVKSESTLVNRAQVCYRTSRRIFAMNIQRLNSPQGVLLSGHCGPPSRVGVIYTGIYVEPWSVVE